jgi:hypothetical protein
MATLVVINYVYTITIFVAMVSVWHQYVEATEKRIYAHVMANFECLQKCADCCKVRSTATDLVQDL